jgi:heme-degrading monooxygenase HmoA
MMRIQFVSFHLQDLSEEAFIALCDQVAPAIAEVPGLISKVFLADPSTNTYGGVYTWRDRESMEAFAGSDIFVGVATNPHLVDLTSADFGILEAPTAVCRGLAAVAA